jgi:DNA-directed RNA polymerase specialized sigma24 family protein
MSRGRALQHYGKLGVANLSSEVKAIWYSRHIEPDLVLRQDFARRLVAITPLTEIEEWAVALCVLDNCTLREAGQEMDRTQERVRQILMKAMRKFRTCQKALTGMHLWELDTRDMSYFWWRHEQRRKHD